MNPVALPELIRRLFGKSYMQVPLMCGKCGSPSAGDWFTGYYLPCIEREHTEMRRIDAERIVDRLLMHCPPRMDESLKDMTRDEYRLLREDWANLILLQESDNRKDRALPA
jgi:hypothetical protein